ncbi:MAG: hypothetical protein AAB786_02255 [Patescibacteria group bacterium]
MTTQIMFKIEEKLKKAAQKRAKEQGITLSDLFQSAARSFVEGRINVGLTREDMQEDLEMYNSVNYKKSIARARKSKKFYTSSELYKKLGL